MSDLDVIADLLSRLPVKTLLRFRCVSKSWCGLIDSRDFMRWHLNRSMETNTNRSLIFRESKLLYSIDLDSLDDALELDHPLKNEEGDTEVIDDATELDHPWKDKDEEGDTEVIDDAIELDHPWKDEDEEGDTEVSDDAIELDHPWKDKDEEGDTGVIDDAVELDHPLKNEEGDNEVIGCCDGMLCLFNFHKGIALWNPWTGKHHTLQVTPIPFPYECDNRYNLVFGFGYDCVSDDYKVVRIAEYFREDVDSFDSEVMVYSVKSNSWRRIQDFPYCHRYRANGRLVNGALHWAVFPRPSSDRAELIAAFDLGVEEYRLVPQPELFEEKFKMSMEILGGCLCVVCENYGKGVDIWVMKEYGVKESWSRLFCVEQPKPNTWRMFNYVWPLAFSKSGGEVLLVEDGRRLFWYHLKMKTIKYIEIRGIDSIMETDICFGSLCSASSWVGVP